MKKKIKSVRSKLFLTLCIVILMLIAFLVIINSCVLESVYHYSKKNSALEIYEYINQNIDRINEDEISSEIEKKSIENDFEIVLKDNEGIVFITKNDFSENFGEIPSVNYDVEYSIFSQSDIIYSTKNIAIRKIQDKKNGLDFILLSGKLDNGNLIFLRTPTTAIRENVKISNDSLYIISAISIIFGGLAITFITGKFTKPIEELNDIANKMSKLDFSQKYKNTENNDEIDELGKSINIMSYKLEETIKKLKQSNSELERDIEEKSKIDEMRKQFISDVSHELKTPISLIQGYSEGLIENVNSDEESRKFYADVILDEANKMDQLVKQLLELMKLEYGERQFTDSSFDIVELINDVIRNQKVRIDEQKIKVEFKYKGTANIYADSFYIEQVFRNYFTNAIKNIKEVNGEKTIKISINKQKNNKYKINVFNSGDNIEEENLNRIWNRFYKIDKSRNRQDGGTGIGLSLVKAIMNQYGNDYGVVNKKEGVEFYFEVQADENNEEGR